MTLCELVDDYLTCLLEDVELDTEVQCCNQFGEDHLQMHAVLWSFLQCVGVPVLELDLKLHSPLDWMRLSGPALRSALQKCPQRHGYVYAGWRFAKGPDHSTLFRFDEATGEQEFFDPSWACSAEVPWAVKLFRQRHFWLGRDCATCHVVDANCSDRELQFYFEPMKGDESVPRGSCTSVCILFLVCCLRFRCASFQTMADAMRACMKGRQYTREQQKTLVAKLYAWHKQLNPPTGNVSEWLRREGILRVCGLRVPNGKEPRQCGVLLGGTNNCCKEPPCTGWALCRVHLQEMLNIEDCAQHHPLLSEIWSKPRVPIEHHLPLFMRSHDVEPTTNASDDNVIGTVLFGPWDGTTVIDGRRGRYTILRLHEEKIDDLVSHIQRMSWESLCKQNPRLLLEIYVPHSFSGAESLIGSACGTFTPNRPRCAPWWSGFPSVDGTCSSPQRHERRPSLVER